MASQPSTLMRQHRVEDPAGPAASLAPPPGHPRHWHMHTGAFSDQVNKYLNVQNSYLGITHSVLQSISNSGGIYFKISNDVKSPLYIYDNLTYT